MIDRRHGHELVRPGKRASVAQPKWFKITVATTIPDTTNRWVYTGVEQEAVDAGWQTLSGGETVEKLYNAIEANNDGTGIQGHGVDIDGADYPAGFAVMPLAVGAVVRAWALNVTIEGEQELQWWCCDPNADDGTCSTGPLAIALGGTFATTVAAARSNLEVPSVADGSYRWIDVTVGALGDPTAGHFRVTYQVKDSDGDAVAEKWVFETWWADTADVGVPFATLGWTNVNIVTGTRHQSVGGSSETDDEGAFTWLVHTDSSGVAVIDFDANAAETRHVNALIVGKVKGSQSATWT